ncbi:hypothetical protein AMECASPLE_018658 [Ameca splendens]|uniref:Uncharacterized protein n=1 Tax=Ameca splendens TaxID=208324 RepID=A0ABV0YE69_9TELE
MLDYLSVDHQLPDAGEAGEHLLPHKNPQHQHPRGCILSPYLFSFYTNDWTSADPCVKFLKLRITPLSLVYSRTMMSLHTDRRWIGWSPGVVRTQDTGDDGGLPTIPPLTILNNTV